MSKTLKKKKKKEGSNSIPGKQNRSVVIIVVAQSRTRLRGLTDDRGGGRRRGSRGKDERQAAFAPGSTDGIGDGFGLGMGAVRRLTAGFVESATAVAVVGAAVDFGVAAGDAGLVNRAEEAVGGHGRRGSDHRVRKVFEEKRERGRKGMGEGREFIGAKNGD